MHFIGILIGGNESLLEQYWEGLEVEEYVSSSKESIISEYINTRNSNIEWRQEKIKNNDPKSSEYQEWINNHPKLNKRTAWKIIKKDYEGHIDSDGNILSTYNPNAQWDWYSIGGRWSPYFPLKEKDENGETVWSNTATIEQVNWEEYKATRKFPYCYITGEGEWVARGEIGWFSSQHDELPDVWQKRLFDELSQYPVDTPIVAIDFHI